MKWWLTAWQVLRDVALTGTGMWLIISQVGSKDPSSVLITAGLVLTVPAAASHAMAVLSGPSAPGHGPGESSPSPPPPSSSPPSRPAGVTDDGG